MPQGTPIASAPYDTIGKVMDAARSFVNDMMNDSSGDLLTNDAPYAQTYLSTAWEWLQNSCDTVGIETFEKEVILFGLPAMANLDTANRCWISWTGCSDGVNLFDNPCLPQDMISPKTMHCRLAMPLAADGSMPVNTNRFRPMSVANGGLPSFLACDSTIWNDDVLYFGGYRQPHDFQMLYSAYRADLDITNPNAKVPLMRCKNALGARVAYEFTSARSGPQSASATGLEARADKEFATLRMRSGRRRGRKNIRRQPYSGRGSEECYGNYFPYNVNN